MLRRICRACAGLCIRADDPPESRRMKKLSTPVFIGVIVVCAIVIGAQAAQHPQGLPVPLYLSGVGAYTALTGAVAALVLWYTQSSLSRLLNWLDSFNLLALFSIVLIDFTFASTLYFRCWPIMILCLDVLLVFERDHMQNVVLGAVALYLAVERMESAVRVGLYEAAVFNGHVVSSCNCAEPPCADNAVLAFNTYIGTILLLLGDFHLTRGFATTTRRQVRVMEATVSVADKVTAALARYETDAAVLAITSAESILPNDLKESLLSLVVNLNEYKPFLPEALLGERESQDQCQTPAPGLGESEANVAIVFTDIQSS
eukprot:Hpha_TRINITY_DN15800_c3_g1::TRINITY_DN15800_c3_g1_i1::g.186980::m.186980